MSYQVLARKWRPQTFADVVGQEHVLTALANGLSLGRIHHAYLFSGTRGVGKTSIARLLAKGLNCETGITATPCGVCDNCREIEQGRFVDLIEIDAASRTKVEDTRDLLDNVQYAPARGRFKVYLIDEVHMLSRHSFNALLKTLEEPPAHVKFLLATTDPQKLPVTILSRCLQFHLKALDVEQIRHQLEHILNEEHIAHEPRALQLLSRAADGSLRDALSLTDQAIASGDGQVSTQAVSAMLGTLDDDQALSLVEAVVDANGERVMSLINEAAARGIEWEALLVEMLSLLHRIAMVQLSPAALGCDMAAIEQRMRELARTVPPGDLQLYYQTLLIGRKELPWAPDRRMGVEMTLLRALAFHPRMPLPEPETPRQSFAPVAPTAVMTPTQVPQQPAPASQTSPAPLPASTSQVLAARNQLQRAQGATKTKKSEPAAASRARPVNNSALERLASVSERVQARPAPSALETAPVKKEAYRWKATTPVVQTKEVVATPKALKKALEHEKTPELAAKLAAEAIERDPWAAQVSQLSLPKLVEQVALNAWKEQNGNEVCLHLRSTQRHLNSSSAQQTLAQALSDLTGTTVELTIVEDDNPAVRTPLEWRQAIYEEKLAQARESIIADNNIQTLCRFFDAELDDESIRPI
ncbi:TPA_asm: DNA polymerase III subunit gamma/tau [Salmonella enterica subsp. houtenae serovar 16:z4,z32:-]|uniref:DNA polymerase III subunit gamma/tau n=1 Tax=Salmonella enterica subsp. houtenae serovar 16:z4,z32:- TaxID=1307497 RepID=A0A735P006_SALHO|nr:DNA polymerase III subunit gamma/tau [Salmonella enterica]ECE6509300.1 DNA polymerase III subunit gamma/tau [Salmonella enterica subsp. houtenae]EDS7539278.1 DNA polymerase III subunit gamma/tau [Salmonella enterica subsp. enterica]EGI6409555.1 DNA polymerase III subunit gamma/tau [Salmonella enterica subsp. houtenae serovar 16:z4,z32:-]ENZ88003.1 DNA polymerase III subunit gamma [Salmonella enterica subsp. houtenae serovar 16:z4,z32:-- str. RKS3027]QGF85527.1 DNA polymerase III subunit gam